MYERDPDFDGIIFMLAQVESALGLLNLRSTVCTRLMFMKPRLIHSPPAPFLGLHYFIYPNTPTQHACTHARIHVRVYGTLT